MSDDRMLQTPLPTPAVSADSAESSHTLAKLAVLWSEFYRPFFFKLKCNVPVSFLATEGSLSV